MGSGLVGLGSGLEGSGSGLVGSGSGLVGLVGRGSGIFTKEFDRPKYIVHRVENGTRLTNWVTITVFFRQKFFGLGGLDLGKIGLGNLFPCRQIVVGEGENFPLLS